MVVSERVVATVPRAHATPRAVNTAPSVVRLFLLRVDVSCATLCVDRSVSCAHGTSPRSLRRSCVLLALALSLTGCEGHGLEVSLQGSTVSWTPNSVPSQRNGTFTPALMVR